MASVDDKFAYFAMGWASALLVGAATFLLL